MKRDPRLIIIFSAFMLVYVAIITKLFFWQIVSADRLRYIGRSQSVLSTNANAKRGDILFSDNFPIATNKISYLLYVNPKKVDDFEKYSNLLAPLVESDPASISARIKQDLYWVSIKSRLSFDAKKQIEALKLNALGFELHTERNYPEASLAAHLIGFVGKNSEGQDQGYFGIEGYYDRQLSGRTGTTDMIKDALGNPILTDIREEKKIDGRTLITSIDRSVQLLADNELRRGVEKYGAEGGSIIIMKSTTGEILAASSYPKFNPQKYWEYDGSTYSSPIISNLYEPGSTFKVLVMAAALDTGLLRPQTHCPVCSGPVSINEYKIKTWNDKYYPNITMSEVIVHSDNTGMVYVGRKLGIDIFLHYLKQFGLGGPTGIDMQGETWENIRPDKKWKEIDLATASFGQGISVTPIQLIAAINSIANKGDLVRPMLVNKILTPDGKIIEIKPEVKRKVFKESTVKSITEMMVNAVENGEAKFAKLPNYHVAGKTGTAQIPVEGHYDPDSTNASFIGFFPADKPEITMLVIVNKPTSSIYGAETAAPIFFSVAKGLIQYYNIMPSS